MLVGTPRKRGRVGRARSRVKGHETGGGGVLRGRRWGGAEGRKMTGGDGSDAI